MHLIILLWNYLRTLMRSIQNSYHIHCILIIRSHTSCEQTWRYLIWQHFSNFGFFSKPTTKMFTHMSWCLNPLLLLFNQGNQNFSLFVNRKLIKNNIPCMLLGWLISNGNFFITNLPLYDFFSEDWRIFRTMLVNFLTFSKARFLKKKKFLCFSSYYPKTCITYQ